MLSNQDKRSPTSQSELSHEDFVTVAVGDDAARMGQEILERALGSDLLQEVLNGRPPLGNIWRGKGHRSPMLTFRLPDELAAQFRDVVTLTGKPQSEVLREAVLEYVQRHA